LELDLDDEVRLNETLWVRNMTGFICYKISGYCDMNVDINKKPCPNGCRCFLNRRGGELLVDCTLQIQDIQEMPIPIIGNVVLYVDKTNLTQLPNQNLYGYWNLEKLHLSQNQLTNITVEQLPPKLTYLGLEFNDLESLDSKVLEYLSKRAGKITMRLSGNPWKCSEDDQDMIKFFKNESNLIYDRHRIECNGKLIEDEESQNNLSDHQKFEREVEDDILVNTDIRRSFNINSQ